MITLTAENACGMMKGDLANPSSHWNRFRGVSIDTRSLEKGNAFFCLAGANTDGHDYAGQARDAGAGAIVCDRAHATQWRSWQLPVIGVDDPLTALGDLAAGYVDKFRTHYIAVTGSVGKTTTKELIAAALSARYAVYKSPGNFNNLIGIPLALLSRPDPPPRVREFAVLEFGMSTPGEIRRLVEIVRPQFGVVTRIGTAHLMQMKSIEAIAAAKYELFEGADENMTAVLNADDPWQRQWVDRPDWRAQTATYSVECNNPSDFFADQVESTQSGVRFRVNNRHQFELRLAGEYNVPNALAAIAVAARFEIPYKRIAEKLVQVRPEGDRSRLIKRGGVILIADCYNANPTSMMAALDNLARFPKAARRIAVLGTMRELGEKEATLHQEAGEKAACLDLVITVGEDALMYVPTDKRGRAEWRHTSTRGDAISLVTSILRPGDVILVKASHSEKLEEVVEAIKKRLSTSHTSASRQPASSGKPR